MRSCSLTERCLRWTKWGLTKEFLSGGLHKWRQLSLILGFQGSSINIIITNIISTFLNNKNSPCQCKIPPCTDCSWKWYFLWGFQVLKASFGITFHHADLYFIRRTNVSWLLIIGQVLHYGFDKGHLTLELMKLAETGVKLIQGHQWVSRIYLNSGDQTALSILEATTAFDIMNRPMRPQQQPVKNDA